jgi:hypothetical protein
MNPEHCPVITKSQTVLEDTQRLAISSLRLQRTLQGCQRCECFSDCAFIQNFNAQFDAALQYVMESWNLAGTL